jgi:hypothetical protein
MRRELICVKKFAPYAFGAFLFFSLYILPVGQIFSQESTAVASVSPENEVSDAYVSGLTSARARSVVGGVIGLVSLVIGWRSRLRQKAGHVRSRIWPKVGLALAGITIVLSVIHLGNNKGEFGSGGGKAGAIVAFVFGIVGVTLNGLVLRSASETSGGKR